LVKDLLIERDLLPDPAMKTDFVELDALGGVGLKHLLD